MNAEQMFQRLQNSKGQIMRGEISSRVETLKTGPNPSAIVEKVTKGFFACGTDYANRKSVIEGIANGERGEVQSLPWGEWRENRFPFIIDHTPKGGKPTEYFRLYPPTEKQMEIFNLKFAVQFYENAIAISRERAIELCGSKAKAREELPDCFTIKVENIALLGELDCDAISPLPHAGIVTGERGEITPIESEKAFA